MSSISLDTVTVPNFKTLISVTIQGDEEARQPVDQTLRNSFVGRGSATTVNSGLQSATLVYSRPQSVTFGSMQSNSASTQSSRSRIVGNQTASTASAATFQFSSANPCPAASDLNLDKTVNAGIVKPIVHEPDEDVVDVDSKVVGDKKSALIEDSDVGTTNVILIVDRSGSMAGSWINMTKEALVKLIPDNGNNSNLKFVALILFDHEVEFHDTSQMSTSQVRQLIRTIHAGGGTNFERPMRELRIFISIHRLTNLSVLMCTDGDECEGRWTREFRPLQEAIRISGIKLSFNFLAFTPNADVDFFLSLKNLSNIPSTVQQVNRLDMLRNAILRLADLLDISRHVTLEIEGQEEILLEERAFVPMENSSSVFQMTQHFRRGRQSLPVASERQRTIHELTDFDELSAVLLALIMDIRKLVDTETPKDVIKTKCESLKQLVDSLFESDESKQTVWKSSTQYKLIADALVQVTNQLEDPVVESYSTMANSAQRPFPGTFFGGRRRTMAKSKNSSTLFGGPPNRINPVNNFSTGPDFCSYSGLSFGSPSGPAFGYSSSPAFGSPSNPAFGSSPGFSFGSAAPVNQQSVFTLCSHSEDSEAPIRDRRREMEMFFSSPAVRMAYTQRTAGGNMDKDTEETVDGQD